MQLTFWGAAGTVTGSQHLITCGGENVLLDCGFFQGKRGDADRINRTLPFAADKLDAMVLSHAHIDHSGNIPNLVKSGFHGSIHATHATLDLCKSMLMDSAKIQESDALWLVKHGKPAVPPIYTIPDAERALGHFREQALRNAFDASANVRCTFDDAGHMLGSAHELLELREGGNTVRLAFSGDLGRPGLPILRDPAPMAEADYLVIEGTYGDRLHQPVANARPDLLKAIQDTVRRGGKIVIPAFAVGRTQEIVYHLNALMNDGSLPNIPVYVDSPLATNVTQAFRENADLFDDETKAELRQDRDGDAFGFGRLKYTRDSNESKAINDIKGPVIVISASGMCEAGRVLHHLRNMVGDPKNLLLFVSFQGQETLGRRLLDGVKRVRILGDEFVVRCEIEQLSSFSGHADQNDLLHWVGPRAKSLKRAFIVHAEEKPAIALAAKLKSIGVRDVMIPARGDIATL